jgi:non-specific serine/threonine protein kinase
MASGTAPRSPGTLPAQPSGFVGRVAELAQVAELLQTSRLVTITGVGGVGKTRLALRVAEKAAKDFRDGAYLAELSAVADPGLLVHTLAAGLCGQETADSAETRDPREAGGGAGHAPLEVLLGFLHDRELLLILDTCEHLVDACAELADRILGAAPGVSILATSRQPLDAAGETTMLLLPLPVPDPDAALNPPADAVELFAQRAAAAIPGFTVTPDNVGDIIAICRRLDGIPLAIELATVRLRALPLRQMAERIDDRLRLLTGGRRSGAARHHTLRAAIEWSHSLCTPAEQTLWARLSVFAGSFDLAAAEAVCSGGALPKDAILSAIIGLVDKNVLARASAADLGTDREIGGGSGGGGRDLDGIAADGITYRMLDTIREFGLERLAQAGAPTEAMVRSRFIAHYLALAERFHADPVADQFAQYQRLRREHGNLRAAFDYALALSGNNGAAIVLATSLVGYWRISGLLREGEYWLDRVIDRCPERSVVRARVLSARAYLRVMLTDLDGARQDAVAALDRATTFSDAATCGRAHAALHLAAAFGGDLAEVERAGRNAVASFTTAADEFAIARVETVTAISRLQAGDPDGCLASAANALRRLPEDELWCTGTLLGVQAVGYLLRGDRGRANAAVRDGLRLTDTLGDLVGTAYELCVLAFIAASENRYERTAWLFGGAAPLWDRAGRWYLGARSFEALHQIAERLATDGLGEDRYWAARATGQCTPLPAVIELALGDADFLLANRRAG